MNSSRTEDGFGLLANGSSRLWDVSIDESLTHEGQWLADLEGPSVYISFQLKDLNVVSEAITFLSAHLDAQSATKRPPRVPLTLGKFGNSSVSLMWDDEDFLRCFLVVGAQAQSCARITLFKDDVEMLRDALVQLKRDM